MNKQQLTYRITSAYRVTVLLTLGAAISANVALADDRPDAPSAVSSPLVPAVAPLRTTSKPPAPEFPPMTRSERFRFLAAHQVRDSEHAARASRQWQHIFFLFAHGWCCRCRLHFARMAAAQHHHRGDGAVSFGISMGSDVGFNVVREFWPGLRRHRR